MKKVYVLVFLIGLVIIGCSSKEKEREVITETKQVENNQEIIQLSPCGNGILDIGETLQNCRGDYIPRCGNNICEPQFREHYGDCSEDCPDFCIVDDNDKYSGADECEYTKNRAEYEANINNLLKTK